MFVALQGPVFGQLATQLLACIGAVSLVGWVVLGTGRVTMLLGQDCAHQAPEKVIVELPSKNVVWPKLLFLRPALRIEHHPRWRGLRCERTCMSMWPWYVWPHVAWPQLGPDHSVWRSDASVV